MLREGFLAFNRTASINGQIGCTFAVGVFMYWLFVWLVIKKRNAITFTMISRWFECGTTFMDIGMLHIYLSMLNLLKLVLASDSADITLIA